MSELMRSIALDCLLGMAVAEAELREGLSWDSTLVLAPGR